jgi:hypothetical protein
MPTSDMQAYHEGVSAIVYASVFDSVSRIVLGGNGGALAGLGQAERLTSRKGEQRGDCHRSARDHV